MYLVGFLPAFVAEGFSWRDGADAVLSFEELLPSSCSSSSSCNAAANRGPAESEKEREKGIRFSLVIIATLSEGTQVASYFLLFQKELRLVS